MKQFECGHCGTAFTTDVKVSYCPCCGRAKLHNEEWSFDG